MSDRRADVATLTYASMERDFIQVWNSRPGLVPTTIDHDGKSWVHLHALDEPTPEGYLPKAGDLVIVDLTTTRADRTYLDAVRDWPHDPESVRRRRDIRSRLQLDAARNAGVLTTATPALCHALGSARARQWVPFNSHTGAKWVWEDGAPFLTCDACSSAHPSAALTLDDCRDHLTVADVDGDLLITVPQDVLWHGQASTQVILAAAHAHDHSPAWQEEHHLSMERLRALVRSHFRAEAHEARP